MNSKCSYSICLFIISILFFSSCGSVGVFTHANAFGKAENEIVYLNNFTDYPFIISDKQRHHQEVLPDGSAMKIVPGEYYVEGFNLQRMGDRNSDEGYYSCSTQFEAKPGKEYSIKVTFARNTTFVQGGLAYLFDCKCSVFEK